ncbi:MAG: NAD-dependent succinate-semialdehyde dehydrogenase [Gammaproteobacteria bacterium]|nr:NAD-dependent succinate-semialdehyde dehydrogenase [Gammaproteobacteria bacterium]
MIQAEPKPQFENQFSDAGLFRQQAYVDGAWVDAPGGETTDVTNPADGAVIGQVPMLGAVEARGAIEAASRAFPAWRALLPQERGELMENWYRLLLAHREDLARIMTLEQGKPLSDSRGEIDYAASFIKWFAEEGRRMNGETLPSHLPDRRLLVYREPVGVTACITPWNFPAAMITRKAAAALAAGCPMVVRPANETPFSALALAELAERAGIPAGVFSVLTGSGREIGGEMCANTLVRALSFTGSTEVGRVLLRQGAETVKKMSMELGGHAPFIGYPDVGVERLVEGALAAKFQTTGQDCLAANRIYIHRDIYDQFLEAFTRRTAAFKVGNGLDEDVDYGPLMNEDAVRKAEEHVEDAVSKGARLLTGGKRLPLGELFFAPAVLADVTPDMAIYREETFGPVAGVTPFDDGDDIAAMANDSEYGLASYIYCDNLSRVHRLSAALEYGMVAVNCAKMTGPPIPFGGVKQSGLGREGSTHGLDEYSDLKYVCIQV